MLLPGLPIISTLMQVGQFSNIHVYKLEEPTDLIYY